MKVYNGSTNVKEFITVCELECSVKDYAGEKKANYVGSKLAGPAFDVYMRLSDAQKKDFEEIKKELYKEFEKGNLDREEAIQSLSSRQQLPEESVQTYAFKLSELVKLAYPTFAAAAQNTIAKDYFVRGLHPSMQTALKSSPGFTDMDLKGATDETVRLELAGVKSAGTSRLAGAGVNVVESGNSVMESNDFIDSVAEKVVEKLSIRESAGNGGDGVNWSGDQSYGRNNNRSWRGSNRGGRRGYGGGAGRGRGRGRGGNTSKKCRSCQSTDHIVRDCPKRFCQACGKQGHDQFDSDKCENYQL